MRLGIYANTLAGKMRILFFLEENTVVRSEPLLVSSGEEIGKRGELNFFDLFDVYRRTIEIPQCTHILRLVAVRFTMYTLS